MSAASPIDDPEFAAMMAPLGPFERPPRLAVAVSGGADSLALTLLAGRWADARGGALLALTVDHGLRPNSSDEAAQVGRWLAGRDIDHQVIRWLGDKPNSGLQEVARAARYGLLLGRCRHEGILHLLVAHHQGDQAETLLLRLASGSGQDGLAAMAPAVATASARLLRPLLGVPRSRLEATLTALGQAWIDDPSNRNRAFARVRVRQSMPGLAEAGLDTVVLADTAKDMARLRSERDHQIAALLAQAATVSPAGYARIDAAKLGAAPDEIGWRALDRLIRTIGGGIYPLQQQRLDRLWKAIRGGLAARRSLGGCLISLGRGGLLLAREPAAMEPPRPVRAGQTARWDGRFVVRLGGSGAGHVGALGRDGWLAIKGQVQRSDIPRAIVSTLPTLFDAEGAVSVPHLGWRREKVGGPSPDLTVEAMAYSPNSPLTGIFWGS